MIIKIELSIEKEIKIKIYKIKITKLEIEVSKVVYS